VCLSEYNRRVNYELKQHGEKQDGKVALEGEILMNRTAGYLDDRHPALQYDVRVRLREAATARRVPVRSCVRLRRAFDATRSCAELERNVPFYQTNPPILSWKTAINQQRSNWLRNKMLLENGGFVFQNEPTGPPSRGRYGATRPTRRGF
jgi:hypothetical protein